VNDVLVNLDAAVDVVDGLLARGALSRTADLACPYLADRTAATEGFAIDALPPEFYRAFMDRGFRRSGTAVYRPVCPSCRECQPIRVPVKTFKPTRSMRRVLRRNADVRVAPGPPTPTEEKYRLYAAYLAGRHDGAMTGSLDEFQSFLYDSPTRTVEFCYHLGERLVGVSIADVCPDALSSVFMFFDPEQARRSLGTYSVLREIDYCRGMGLGYYYLGYYVAGARTMAYKARFGPSEVLADDHRWVAFRGGEGAP